MAQMTDAQLFVRREEGRLAYRLNVLEPRLGAGSRSFSPVPWSVASASRLEDLLGRLADLAGGQQSVGLEAEEELAGIGLELFGHLVPDGLGRALQELVDHAPTDRAPTLLVLSQEPSIPWELIKLRRAEDGSPGPFLAEVFAVSRWLEGARHVFELPLREVALVVPSDSGLDAAQTERAFVLSLGNDSRRVTEVPARVTPLIEHFATGRFDGWHFTGHGLTAGKDPSGWSLLLEGGKPLTSYLLKNRARLLGAPHPLVFANACQSARQGQGLTRVGGLAKTFVELGAGAFLGTLWRIDDERALEFARTFYSHFLTGLPIAEAVRRARTELRDDQPGDSAWLAYTVFSHPLASCKGSSAFVSTPTDTTSLVLPRSTWQSDRSPPGALLRAEYGVVPFHGRDEEMADLQDWAKSDAEVAVRLYTGPGGMGKTRLALELCQRLREEGWQAGFVPVERPIAADELVRQILEPAAPGTAGGNPLLVVVDYAETEHNLLVPLLRELLSRSDVRARLLLLARAALDWWDYLKTERGVGELLSGPATSRHALKPLTLGLEERTRSYRLAGAAFSERLGQGPREEVPGDLDAGHYERVLLLHMSALAAVEGVEVKGEDGILDFVLNRERRFWRERAERLGLSRELVPGIGRAMAGITLLGGASDEGQSLAVLERLDELRDQPHAVRRAVARLLHECYPGARWVEPMLPDLLGEHLVQRELEIGEDDLFGLVDEAGSEP